MPRDSARVYKIGDQIQRELAELLRTEVKDPRLGLITLTSVEVSRDKEHAKVFYTRMQGETREAQAVLEKTAGFLRAQVARRMRLRIMPTLSFAYDNSVEHGMAMDRLIDQALASDALHPSGDDGQD
jgi:ribosome-binding factor A